MEIDQSTLKIIIWIIIILIAITLIKKVINLIRRGMYKIATLYITLITGTTGISAYNIQELFNIKN